MTDMFNPIKWIKDKIAERKRKKKLEEKLKKLKEQDPFIYD
jgi:hypothetical protein